MSVAAVSSIVPSQGHVDTADPFRRDSSERSIVLTRPRDGAEACPVTLGGSNA